jgi:hypothetical protein
MNHYVKAINKQNHEEISKRKQSTINYKNQHVIIITTILPGSNTFSEDVVMLSGVEPSISSASSLFWITAILLDISMSTLSLKEAKIWRRLSTVRGSFDDWLFAISNGADVFFKDKNAE